ncbi:MAG: hypothetical protein ACOY9Y_09810 [Bacillota bacterium]
MLGEIEAYCYMVKRGKPAAMVPTQTKNISGAVAIIERNDLRLYKEKLSEGWLTLWIYKYPHVLEIIKSLPQVPKTVFDHWVLGKLFGYEEIAIQEFLESKQE